MNLPNKLTILRLILIVPFITFMAYAISKGNLTNHDKNIFSYDDFLDSGAIFFMIAGIIFLCAMVTDFVDGYLARKHDSVTTFGKLFDPLADKFMTTSALIMLSIAQIVPFWLIIIFILRDILVDGSRNLAAANNVKIEASIWGKIKTMLMSIAIVVLFFVYPAFDFGTYVINGWEWSLIALNTPLIVSAFLSVLSGIKYFKNIIPYINLK